MKSSTTKDQPSQSPISRRRPRAVDNNIARHANDRSPFRQANPDSQQLPSRISPVRPLRPTPLPLMSRNFEELDYQETPLGAVSLRRQRLMMFGDREIHEVKLGDDYLMSSLFTKVEEELATLSLNALATARSTPDVVVGGLGLGYTAWTALQHAVPCVRELLVVD